MTSPVKRPAVTYQRSRKITKDHLPPAVASNPNSALQQKINDFIFSKDQSSCCNTIKEFDEFDSAYHETNVHTKCLYCLLKVFIYLFIIILLLGKC